MYIIKKNSKKCSCYIRKNITCGGTFSNTKFDELETAKIEVLRKKVEARGRLTALAYEFLAVTKEQEALDKRLDKIHNRQEEIVN